MNTNATENAERQAHIQEILCSFFAKKGIIVRENRPSHGPFATTYTLLVEDHSARRRCRSLLEKGLEEALGISPICIKTPYCSEPTIIVELPPSDPARICTWEQVRLERPSEPDSYKGMPPVCIGYDTDGKPIFVSPDRLPHLLVTGEAGTGKTSCLRGLLLGMAQNHTPSELKCVVIAPKKEDPDAMRALPHLTEPVIHSPSRALEVLRELVEETDRRFARMIELDSRSSELLHVRSITDYNACRGVEPMSRYAVFIDDVEDLLCGPERKALVSAIVSLLQKSRAAGIFLFLGATSIRPSRLPSAILSCVPSYISFRQPTYADSERIFGQRGAEKLTFPGDMLFSRIGMIEPIRAQSPLVTERDL